jgi:hypothetical protein
MAALRTFEMGQILAPYLHRILTFSVIIDLGNNKQIFRVNLFFKVLNCMVAAYVIGIPT